MDSQNPSKNNQTPPKSQKSPTPTPQDTQTTSAEPEADTQKDQESLCDILLGLRGQELSEEEQNVLSFLSGVDREKGLRLYHQLQEVVAQLGAALGIKREEETPLLSPLEAELVSMLDSTDLIAFFDIKLCDKDGLAARTRGNQQLTRIFAESSISDSRSRFHRTMEDTLRAPLYQSFQELVNQAAAKPVPSTDENSRLHKPIAPSTMSGGEIVPRMG